MIALRREILFCRITIEKRGIVPFGLIRKQFGEMSRGK